MTIHAGINETRSFRRLSVGSVTGITVGAVPFDIQACQKRDCVLGLTVRLLSADGSRCRLLRGGSRMNEAAAFAVGAASSYPKGLYTLRA